MTYTKIGCEAWIVRDGKVLLMKRGPRAKGPYEGTWALPGGHLKLLERVDEAIIRELKEELDLEVAPTDVQPMAITDDLRPHLDEHYLHITFRVDIGSQEPTSRELDKCPELGWFSVDDLPDNTFPFHTKIFDTLKTKKLYLGNS
jgi:8-oxo-dGTP diphosphatase